MVRFNRYPSYSSNILVVSALFSLSPKASGQGTSGTELHLSEAALMVAEVQRDIMWASSFSYV